MGFANLLDSGKSSWILERVNRQCGATICPISLIDRTVNNGRSRAKNLLACLSHCSSHLARARVKMNGAACILQCCLRRPCMGKGPCVDKGSGYFHLHRAGKLNTRSSHPPFPTTVVPEQPSLSIQLTQPTNPKHFDFPCFLSRIFVLNHICCYY